MAGSRNRIPTAEADLDAGRTSRMRVACCDLRSRAGRRRGSQLGAAVALTARPWSSRGPALYAAAAHPAGPQERTHASPCPQPLLAGRERAGSAIFSCGARARAGAARRARGRRRSSPPL
eukprot:186966-Chlamydomonas_euryale.AAC.7